MGSEACYKTEKKKKWETKRGTRQQANVPFLVFPFDVLTFSFFFFNPTTFQCSEAKEELGKGGVGKDQRMSLEGKIPCKRALPRRTLNLVEYKGLSLGIFNYCI